MESHNSAKELFVGISIQDVARMANVSVSTVSRSFTRPSMVSAATREKVLRIAEDVNFSISRSAAALKSGKALRVALLMSDQIRRWFSASIIEGLNQSLHPQGYDLSIFQISSIEERREFFSMLPVRRNADAVIVVSFGVDSEEIERLSDTGVPIVGINCASPREAGFTAAVNIDDEQGASLMARHLIGLQHDSIAYVRTARAVSLHFSVQQRYEAFVKKCEKTGAHPATIVASDSPDRIPRILSQLLDQAKPPTAVACQEDDIAIPLMFQLMRSGIKIPSEMSIIGYDDGIYAHDIGLTTIRQSPLQLAKLAGEKTLDLIEKGQTATPFETIPAQLILRASTGPSPSV